MRRVKICMLQYVSLWCTTHIELHTSQGLVTKSRYESLQEHKRPYAHDHPPAQDLLSAVKVIWTTSFALERFFVIFCVSV
jgi:hypothetical protein